MIRSIRINYPNKKKKFSIKKNQNHFEIIENNYKFLMRKMTHNKPINEFILLEGYIKI